MTAVLYPVAANASAALSAPQGRAARASEAVLLAGAAVRFVSESVGPGFATRSAALDAFAGPLDDERPGKGRAVAAEDRYCELRELAEAAAPKPGKSKPPAPVYRDGRRWAAPPPPPATVWRLSISYWKIDAPAGEATPPAGAQGPLSTGQPTAADIQALRERLSQPMRSPKPQKALDIGLFEVPLPEAPNILIPDE
ncbi:MAG: hypothetical protein JO303_10840 [Caulobacteraceae bacterium]|nr:hypothetical protein [Caulobacteraceae bacterium]MBV9813417.1 hypothetical protein [Acetobacteraceae bacterium]